MLPPSFFFISKNKEERKREKERQEVSSRSLQNPSPAQHRLQGTPAMHPHMHQTAAPGKTIHLPSPQPSISSVQWGSSGQGHLLPTHSAMCHLCFGGAFPLFSSHDFCLIPLIPWHLIFFFNISINCFKYFWQQEES